MPYGLTSNIHRPRLEARFVMDIAPLCVLKVCKRPVCLGASARSGERTDPVTTAAYNPVDSHAIHLAHLFSRVFGSAKSLN
jgi:hypothetical protein